MRNDHEQLSMLYCSAAILQSWLRSSTQLWDQLSTNCRHISSHGWYCFRIFVCTDI